MDQVLVQGIVKWLKKYPWLWAVRKSWVSARIRAKKIGTPTELLQAISVGNIFIYAETSGGPFVITPKSELVGKPEMSEKCLTFLRHEMQSSLRFIAVEVGKEITVYKPPQNGWSLDLLGQALELAQANRIPAASP